MQLQTNLQAERKIGEIETLNVEAIHIDVSNDT